MPRSLVFIGVGCFMVVGGHFLARNYANVTQWPKYIIRSPASTPTLDEWKRKNVRGANFMKYSGFGFIMIGLVLAIFDSV
jgi:hypothetical protein